MLPRPGVFAFMAVFALLAELRRGKRLTLGFTGFTGFRVTSRSYIKVAYAAAKLLPGALARRLRGPSPRLQGEGYRGFRVQGLGFRV